MLVKEHSWYRLNICEANDTEQRSCEVTPLEYNTQSATQEVNSQGNVNMYVVLKVCIIYFVGDWSNGMIGVSKTFGGSSILSSPARNL